MATVTGLTADRMLEIEGASVIDGEIVGGNLILVQHDGTQINAGSVVGPAGPAGPVGSDLDVLTAQTVFDVGLANQIRAGRQLTATDFANLGLSAPLGLWNLSTMNDSSGYGRHLLNKGTVPLAAGINGLASTAAQFVGSTGQALYIADTGASDPFRIRVGSYGCWFKTSRTGIVQRILTKHGAAPQFGWQLYIPTTNFLVSRLSSTGSDTNDAIGVTNVCDDYWHFAVAVFDGSRHNLYLDGVLDKTVEEPTSFTIFGSNKPLNIGSYGADGGVAGTESFYGRVDEAFVTGDILTAEQVRNLYCAKIPHTLGAIPSRATLNLRRRRRGAALVVGDFPAAPLRLYNFSAGSLGNEGSQGATGDLSNLGALLLAVAGADGTPGNAYNFLGTGHLACTDTGLPSGLNPFSCGCWLKTSSDVAATGYIMTWGTTQGTNDVRIYLEDGEIKVGSGALASSAGTDIADGRWHFLALVHDNAAADGALRKLYLDGRLNTLGTGINSITLGGANKFLIGASLAATLRFIGQIDAAFVTNTALTADDINKLYRKTSQTFPLQPKNPVGPIEAMSSTDLLAAFDIYDPVDQVDLKVMD